MVYRRFLDTLDSHEYFVYDFQFIFPSNIISSFWHCSIVYHFGDSWDISGVGFPLSDAIIYLPVRGVLLVYVSDGEVTVLLVMLISLFIMNILVFF